LKIAPHADDGKLQSNTPKLKCGGGEVDLSSTHVPRYNCLCVNGQDSNAEFFDVFLCHNSEDKPAVREIAQKLSEKKIKPWLDEEQIRPGTSWQTALG
jgi:TIR domain